MGPIYKEFFAKHTRNLRQWQSYLEISANKNNFFD